MKLSCVTLLASAAIALILPSCVTQIPAQLGQAKLRAAPKNFNRPGPLILVDKVDGQRAVYDKRDYSAILAPGPHVVELQMTEGSQPPAGELVMLLAKAFAPPPPPPPQTVHQFFAENGHDYLFRWALMDDKRGSAIWIEDYTRGGQVVSGFKPMSAPICADPFRK